MKTLVSIIALISISFFAQAQLNGKSMKKIKDGKHVVINEQNHRKVMNVENGKLHGDVLVYNQAGNLIEKHHYFEGKRHGVWTYWNEQGKKTATLQYYLGKKHGQWELFHKNGNLKAIMFYNKGNKIGDWKSFNEEESILASRNHNSQESNTVFSKMRR